MMIIETYTLGPMDNNTYLLVDPPSRAAVVIDPTFDVRPILARLEVQGWVLQAVWLTHAHFDHIAGLAKLQAATPTPLTVGLHPADLELYRNSGDAGRFGMRLAAGPEPSFWFSHGQALALGDAQIEVRHAPGHTPGHVVFYAPAEQALFSGDVLFKNGIGRTDLPGGDLSTLLGSIRSQIFTLPDVTVVYPGHGPATRVGEEKEDFGVYNVECRL